MHAHIQINNVSIVIFAFIFRNFELNSHFRYGLTDAQRKSFCVKRVIVYVWTSEHFNTRTGLGKAGHVAVELTPDDEQGTLSNKSYISFWPYLGNDAAQRWSLIEDYTSDRMLECRQPEYIFCFYTLNTSEIVDIFLWFTGQPNIAWNLIGAYFPISDADTNANRNDIKMEQSCVSLACLTLDAGGINKLLSAKDVTLASSEHQSEASQQSCADIPKKYDIIKPLYHSSHNIVTGLAAISGYVISPDVLVGRLKKAKEKEWNANENVRMMERTVFTTKIGKDTRSVSFSYQHPTVPVPEGRPTENLQNREPDENGNVLDETTYEWLPTDNLSIYDRLRCDIM